MRFKISVEGAADHAGTTPMQARDDALVKASRLISWVHDFSLEKGEGFVGTVGKIRVLPGAINVIPGEVHLYIEFRCIDEKKLRRAGMEIRDFARQLAKTKIRYVKKNRGISLNKSLQKMIENSCRELDLAYKYMPSGAGHDAASMGQVVPSAMIFIPSVGGISHNKDELSRWDDVEHGANVLLHTLLSLQTNPDQVLSGADGHC